MLQLPRSVHPAAHSFFRGTNRCSRPTVCWWRVQAWRSVHRCQRRPCDGCVSRVHQACPGLSCRTTAVQGPLSYARPGQGHDQVPKAHCTVVDTGRAKIGLELQLASELLGAVSMRPAGANPAPYAVPPALPRRQPLLCISPISGPTWHGTAPLNMRHAPPASRALAGPPTNALPRSMPTPAATELAPGPAAPATGLKHVQHATIMYNVGSVPA